MNKIKALEITKDLIAEKARALNLPLVFKKSLRGWEYEFGQPGLNRFIFTLYVDAKYGWDSSIGVRFCYRYGVTDTKSLYYKRLAGDDTQDNNCVMDLMPKDIDFGNKAEGFVAHVQRVVAKFERPQDAELKSWQSYKDSFAGKKALEAPWFICYDEKDFLATVDFTIDRALKIFEEYVERNKRYRQESLHE